MNELLQSIRKNATGLALFALVTVGAIAAAYQLTYDRIEHNIALAQAKALNEIVPSQLYNNDILASAISLDGFDTALLGPLKANSQAYFAKFDNNLITLLLPAVAADGYTQEIVLLIGINPDGTLAGVRVTDHRETPGLGDKLDIKKSDWILSFVGKSLNNPSPERWLVKKDGGDFDQFTGATITPRAVVKAVKNAQEFFAANQERLLAN